DEFHAGLSGVSLPVMVQVRVTGRPLEKTCGAMLFTHFGVSGPAVLDASRHWTRARIEGKDVQASVSFLATGDVAEAERRHLAPPAEAARSHAGTALAGLVPAPRARALVAGLGIALDTPLGQLRREDRRRLVHALTAWPLPVRDSRGYGFAEVTAGRGPRRRAESRAPRAGQAAGHLPSGGGLHGGRGGGGFNLPLGLASGPLAAPAAPPAR